jgi:hypothetical protein
MSVVNESGKVVTTQGVGKIEKAPFESHYSGTLIMDPILLAGAPIEFDFEMIYYREENKKPIIKHSGTFTWNMGDGHEFLQDWEEEFRYVYEYPGNYMLYISYTRSSLATEPDYVFQMNIKIEKADIKIGMIDEKGSIRIDNDTGKNIDVSGWRMEYMQTVYTIPENTIIPSGEQRFIVKSIHNFIHLFSESYLPIQLVRPTGQIHQNEIVRDIGKVDIQQEELFTLDSTQEYEEGSEEKVSIIDIQEKTKTPDMVIWGIGGASIISLLATLFLMFKVREKNEDVVLV